MNSAPPAPRRIEPPVNSRPGMMTYFAPGREAFLKAETLLPELRGDETPEELQFREHVTELHQQAKREYRRGRWLLRGLGSVLCLLVLLLWGYCYYAVFSYAMLEEQISLQRDPVEADRIRLGYTPVTKGNLEIAYSSPDGKRQTVLVERIAHGQIDLPQQFQWRIRGLQKGDVLKITQREGWRVIEQEVTVPAENVLLAIGGEKTLRGSIVSALDAKPLENAEIRVRGTDITTRSSAEGTFELKNLPEGELTFEATKDGFMLETFTLNIGQDDTSGELRLAMSPGLKQGEIRCVLTWDEQPADLDAHLEGPLPNNERFHISYQEKGDLKSKEFVQLDHDAQHGFGPETITVLGVLPGVYKYYVHDYTNQAQVDSDALAKSEAKVRIYYGGQTYTFQPQTDQKGNLWNVCEIVISDDLTAQVKPLGGFEGKKIEGLGLYEKRTREDRMEWIGAYGGTAESEAAVNRALAWLARHQCVKDGGSKGSWGRYCLTQGDDRCRCNSPDDCCPDVEIIGNDCAMAYTGLAVLAFQAGGHFYNNGRKYSENVRAGLDWIVAHQLENGLLVTEGLRKYPGSLYHEKFMYEHGIASFALAEACAIARASGTSIDAKYLTAMRRAIDFTLQIQHKDGGWRYKLDEKEESDTSVSGWQVLALKSAKEAGYELDYRAVDRLKRFFLEHTKGTETRYTHSMAGTEALTGIGMLVRQFLLDMGDSEYVHAAAKRLADYAEQTWKDTAVEEREPDFYTWYKASLAMQQYGGDEWDRWNTPIRDELIRLQRVEGCLSGSWDPFKDQWGEYGGRIYTTALGALSLQVYYRYATQEDRTSGLRSRNAVTIQRKDGVSSEKTLTSEPESPTPESSKLESPKSKSSKSKSLKSKSPKADPPKAEGVESTIDPDTLIEPSELEVDEDEGLRELDEDTK